MKYLEKYQIITLEDNKKYVVIDSVIYQEQNYAYLINQDNLRDQLVVLASKGEKGVVVDILDSENENNKELLEKLTEMFITDTIVGGEQDE